MTTFKRFGCAAVLTAVALVPSVAGAANADFETVADATADATFIDFQSLQVTQRTDPAETLSDVVRVDVDYRSKVLVAVIEVREIRGKSKTVFPLLRTKGGGTDEVFTRGTRGRVMSATESGKDKFCRGGVYTANVEAATFRLKIPASCFGTPDRVRVGAVVARAKSADDNNLAFFIDDARTGKAGPKAFFAPRLGTKLGRG